jgi:acyl-CoA reductase-like NAD-dependent aldehyde dehydrogenase
MNTTSMINPTKDPEVQELLGRLPKQLLIDGQFGDSADGQTFDTEDPGTGEVIGSVAFAGTGDVDRAVRAARRAFDDGRWSDLPPAAKEQVLQRLADLVEEHSRELAMTDTLDMGAPMAMSEFGLMFAVDAIRYYAGWPTKISGSLPQTGPDKLTYVRREPVGVCGQIIPWNAPLLEAACKVAPALATGCTVVLKPSELAPLSSLRFGELCLEAGVPEGVVNVISGDGTTGAALSEHPDVDKIAFTGSVATGKRIMAAAADTLKRVTLELGGKSANIVFPDAPFDDAITGSMNGIFMNSGQICVAGSRLFLHRDAHDAFMSRVAEYLPSFTLGHGLEPGVMLGPLVAPRQLERVMSYIQSGQEEGATLVQGGLRMDHPGYFVEPTVFTDVRNDMRIAREEIFGPVMSVIPFTDIDDVIRQANDTTFGLGAAVWTRDISRAHQVAARLKAGTVWVNCYAEGDPQIPFGGFKQSGIGRELGEPSIHDYTELKSVIVKF